MSIRSRFEEPLLMLANLSRPSDERYPVAKVPGSAGNRSPSFA